MPEIRYPFKNFRYKVEFNGTEAAGFSEVSGADISVDVIEYREGNEVQHHPQKARRSDEIWQHYAEMGRSRFA